MIGSAPRILDHPLRRELLTQIAQSEGGATPMAVASELRIGPSPVVYHAKVLAAAGWATWGRHSRLTPDRESILRQLRDETDLI